MKSLGSMLKRPMASLLLVSTLTAVSLSPAANAADLGVLKTGERVLKAVCHVVTVIDKGFVTVIGATSDKVIKRMESLVEDDSNDKSAQSNQSDEQNLPSNERAGTTSWAPPHMFKY